MFSLHLMLVVAALQGIVNLIAACTARDPSLRPSAAEVVQRLADAG